MNLKKVHQNNLSKSNNQGKIDAVYFSKSFLAKPSSTKTASSIASSLRHSDSDSSYYSRLACKAAAMK